MTEREKDRLIKTTTAKFGHNSKGNQRIELYLDPEEAEAVAALLIEKKDQGAGTGVKLDIHQSKNEYQGRTIEGGFFFVKAKQGGNQRNVNKTYTPKNNEVIEQLKNKQL